MNQLESRCGEGLPKVASQKRLCIVRYGYYPSELNITREAHALRDVGYEVHVICLQKSTEPVLDFLEGIHVYRIPANRRRGTVLRYVYDYNWFFLRATYGLLCLQWKHRFHAVQVNTMPDYLVFCTLFLKIFYRLPVVLHMHEPMPELFESLFNRWYHKPILRFIRVVEHLSLAYADRVITVTREMRDTFVRRNGSGSKISVILNVPDQRFLKSGFGHKAGDRAGGDRPTFTIVCHGTIEERYGLDVIIKAVSILVKELPEIQFRFMGEGDSLGSLLSLAHHLGLASHVRYLGFVPVATMVQEIKKADVAVIAMKRNPYSVLVHTNKMYEYMELGCPVIASRLLSVQAYFPEDTILYFDPGDEEDLAAQLRFAFKNPKLMRERVAHTRLLYNKYSWDCEREKYLSIYYELLGTIQTSDCDVTKRKRSQGP